MTLIVCVDARGGLSFCGRRLSRDRAVCADILALAAGQTIWMNAYSAKLFPTVENICVAEQPAQHAGAGEMCFVENTALPANAARMIVYNWGRDYPADCYLERSGWRCVERLSFSGHSHSEITRETYLR